MRSITIVTISLLIGVFASVAQTNQPPTLKEATPHTSSDFAEQCEETIRQRNVLIQAQYANDLAALAKAFQAKGDLDNLLLVKKEQERPRNSWRIKDDDLVQTPLELHNLQMKYQVRQVKLSQEVAKEFLTMLEEWKKKLTVQGKIEEAVSVKKEIEKIQQQYLASATSDAPPPKDVAATEQPPTAPAGASQPLKKLPMTSQLKMTVSVQKGNKSSSDSSSKYKRFFPQQLSIHVRNIGMDVLPMTVRWRIDCTPYYYSTTERSEGKESDEKEISLKPREEALITSPDYNRILGYVVEAVVDGNIVTSCKYPE